MPKSQPKQQPLALSVETSGRKGSVAIGISQELLGEVSFSAPMRHSAELFGALAGLLDRIGREPSELRHVYVSAGPGSFTGIRIAVTFAKTLYFATQARIVAVNTMDLIADNATDYIPAESAKIDKVATILDAKRRRFFVAVYQRDTGQEVADMKGGIWKKIFSDSLMTAEEFVQRFGHREPIWLLGEGLLYYRDRFKAPGIHIIDEKYWFPQAKKLYYLGCQMAAAGKFADPVGLVPFYLRRPEAEEK